MALGQLPIKCVPNTQQHGPITITYKCVLNTQQHDPRKITYKNVKCVPNTQQHRPRRITCKICLLRKCFILINLHIHLKF